MRWPIIRDRINTYKKSGITKHHKSNIVFDNKYFTKFETNTVLKVVQIDQYAFGCLGEKTIFT